MIPRTKLEAIPFFSAFPRTTVKVLADRAIERKFDTAETIFRAGDSASGVPGWVVALVGVLGLVVGGAGTLLFAGRRNQR